MNLFLYASNQTLFNKQSSLFIYDVYLNWHFYKLTPRRNKLQMIAKNKWPVDLTLPKNAPKKNENENANENDDENKIILHPLEKISDHMKFPKNVFFSGAMWMFFQDVLKFCFHYFE